MTRAGGVPDAGDAAAAPGTTSFPKLVPCLLLRKGQVCLPAPTARSRSRPGPARRSTRLMSLTGSDRSTDRLYLVDLDGIERGSPQLEDIQELSRDIDLWVNAGVPSAESAIDILVAGAQRAVLSSAYLRGPVELRRAWKLSTDWVFEVEIVEGKVQNSGPGWETSDIGTLAQAARAVGIADVVLSPRERDPELADGPPDLPGRADLGRWVVHRRPGVTAPRIWGGGRDIPSGPRSRRPLILHAGISLAGSIRAAAR